MNKKITPAQRQQNNELLAKAMSFVHPDEASLVREAGAYLAWKWESPSGNPDGAAMFDLSRATESNVWSHAFNVASNEADDAELQHRNKMKRTYSGVAHSKVLEVGLAHLPLTINSVIQVMDDPVRLDDFE